MINKSVVRGIGVPNYSNAFKGAISMTIYYVYAYLRESNNTPYYIGKGKGNRAFINHRTKNGGIHTPKDQTKIVFLESNLSELGAFALERRLIRWYGRKDLGSDGILLNRTDGGDGASGLICSEGTRKKMSESGKGKSHKPFSDETREKLSKERKGRPSPKKGKPGKPRTEEWKRNMSVANKGKPCPKNIGRLHTDEWKKNHSERMQGEKHPMFGKPNPNKGKPGKSQLIITCPHCLKIGGSSGMKQHHFDNCALITNVVKTHTEESKRNMSEAKKGKLQPIITCPHCAKIGGSSNMRRWHFDNCKSCPTK